MEVSNFFVEHRQNSAAIFWSIAEKVIKKVISPSFLADEPRTSSAAILSLRADGEGEAAARAGPAERVREAEVAAWAQHTQQNV